MMDEFSKQIMEKMGKTFNGNGCCIQCKTFYICFNIMSLIHSQYCYILFRCLAHVISLATQALIKSHTKSKHYNSASPKEHMLTTTGYNHDEIGLVQAISVKVCDINQICNVFKLTQPPWQEHSSAQCKQLFKDIQTWDGTDPHQLLLDMPVRWSSTYVMLERAESQRKVSNKY